MTAKNVDTEQNACNKVKYKPSDLIGIEYKNERQVAYKQSFYDKKTPLILLHGFAGVGKTFLALHSALTQVLDNSNRIEKVIIVRSAVESGASQGFLPGTLAEKNEPYEMPYKLIVSKLFKEANDAHYGNLKAQGKIEFLSTTYLRGVTLDNCIIIVDETQNLDYTELKTVITRAGDGTRIIMTGDISQNDLARRGKQTGVTKMMGVLKNMKPSFYKVIDFKIEDVLRSGLCSAFLISEYQLDNGEYPE